MIDWIMEKIYGAKYYYRKIYKTKRTDKIIDYTKGGWGHDAFDFYTTKTKYGLKTPLVLNFIGFGYLREGDIILKEMDGKVKRLLIFQITYFNDPTDMFKATALLLDDYEDEYLEVK